MLEQALSLGSIPQWGTFFSMLVILTGLVRVYINGIPARIQAKSERDTVAAAAWKEIEERVNNELEECKKQREAVTKRYIKSDNENFKLRIVVSLVLEELLRLDPESDITKRAQAVMHAITEVENDG